jgi:hypothetical protein
LALLDDIGSLATVAATGGRYFGFVIGGALPAGVAANWLPGIWDQNAALSVMSPVATIAMLSVPLPRLKDSPQSCRLRSQRRKTVEGRAIQ